MYLINQIEEATKIATVVGSLIPYETRSIIINDTIDFIVRYPMNPQEQVNKPPFNPEKSSPFLEPFQPGLFVTSCSSTHNVLLNKYSVVKNHCLICTKKYESQDDKLNEKDFEAIWRCIQDSDYLAFFNCGPESGYSQTHKHIQLIPRNLGLHNTQLPIEKLIFSSSYSKKTSIFSMCELPYHHSCFLLNITDSENCLTTPAFRLLTIYHTLLDDLKLLRNDNSTFSYNLLLTKSFMIIIPRTKDKYTFDYEKSSISINALGFAGSFFFKKPEHFKLLESVSPLNILKDVGRQK